VVIAEVPRADCLQLIDLIRVRSEGAVCSEVANGDR
jgi:hypothetical protein